MKGSNFRYLAKEGARNVYANKLMSLASIGVLMACLLLIGASILLSLNINNLVGYVESQNEMVVFIEDSLSNEKEQQLGDAIKAHSNVASAEFLSKEQALEEQKKELGDAASLLEGLSEEENPYPASYTVKVKDLSTLEQTVTDISAMDGVLEIKAQFEVANILNNVEKGIYTGGLAVIVILAAVSVVIISNTIRLTVYSRRKEINIMKYVGATDWFIRFPFLIEGVLIGLISAVLAFFLLWGGYSFLMNWIVENPTTWLQSMINNLVPFKAIWWQLLGGFALAGSLLGSLGSLVFVRKHLKV